jgi:glutamate transport system substrate-binding protein
MYKPKSTAILGALVLAVSLSACGDGASGDSEVLKIGIKFDQPGLGLKEGSDYTGLDVDVARYIAEKLGYGEEEIQWVQAPTPQREQLIQSGQVDFIVATYSITAKRKEQISFAGPYLIAHQDLLVRADDPSITGPDSLDGKRLCSVTGSTSAQVVKEEVPGVQLQEFATYTECLPALMSRGVDAITTDDTILAGYAAQDQYQGELRLVGEPFSDERYGVGLKKGDTALCQDVTEALEAMIEDGAWQQAIDDNLGPANYEPSPENPPTPEQCA